MDLSLLPTPESEYNRPRTGACFTVRSANSPSYSLARRSGVRRTRALLEEEGEDAEEAGRRNGTKKEEAQADTGYESGSFKGQCEDNETSAHKTSTMLNMNGSSDKTGATCSSPSERRGRTYWKSQRLSSRSRSLDWRTGSSSPDRVKKADVLMLSTKQQAGGPDERRTGATGARGRVMSSVQAYNSASTDAQERNPVNHWSLSLDRTSRGNSLPIRLKSGPGSDFRGTATSGGQSIMERIEKLYGSAGFGKTEDPDFMISPEQGSYKRAAGGTFPRRFSSGEKKGRFSPMVSKTSFTWMQKDAPETSLCPWTSRTRDISPRGLGQGESQGLDSGERGVHCTGGLDDVGTRSLDRARSRRTIAAQIRAARAAGGITEPPTASNTFSEEGRFSSEASERWASGIKDQSRVTHEEEKIETNGINRTIRETAEEFKEQEKHKETNNEGKEKAELKRSCTDEDVFESGSQKVTKKTFERKKFPSSTSQSASVKNKISQFEALTQRFQGLATGQAQMPRRTFSVPTQLGRSHDGVKKSGSAKAIGGRDKWEGLKEGEEAGEKSEKAKLSQKKLESGRSLSVDEIGLRLEGKETDASDIFAEGRDKYSRLKTTLEIPLNGGGQRQRRSFYIDETDFSKVSSPEEACKTPPPSLPSSSSDTSTGAQRGSASALFVDDDKTPTNTPNHSPLLSPTTQPQITTPSADSRNENTSVLTQAAETPQPDSSPFPHPLATSSQSNIPELISPDVTCSKRKKPVLDLEAWVAGLNTKIKVWNDDEDDDEDDDESTQKDEDSNYDSDSGESSVTVTSNMSQSDRKSFSVSLSDLCNFAGVDYESENDSDEWQSTSKRTASLSSDMSALSYVSVMPSEELDRLLEDVRSLGDSNLQEYNDVQVVVLHKEVGVGLGFSVAGGVDQNKPITVHKVFHSGVAAQEGSIRERDQVLSINGTSLCGYLHWEALRVLRRAKTRELGVVVLRRGGISGAGQDGGQTNNPGSTETQPTETGQRVCVRLEKNNRDLGFSLEGGVGSSLENRPLTVQKIFQGGPVDKVCPGDEVLEIDGVSMVGMRRLEAWTLIRRLPPGPVDVVLLRPLRQLEK